MSTVDITEQDILSALFDAMPQVGDRPAGAYLADEIYEQGQQLGGAMRIGRNRLMRRLRAGVESGIIELIEVRMSNIRGGVCMKPMYRLKNSNDIKTVV